MDTVSAVRGLTTMTTTTTITAMPLLPITSVETLKKCANLPLRSDDVFICSYPKSGTTWTQHIVISLLLCEHKKKKEKKKGSKDIEMEYQHVSGNKKRP